MKQLHKATEFNHIEDNLCRMKLMPLLSKVNSYRSTQGHTSSFEIGMCETSTPPFYLYNICHENKHLQNIGIESKLINQIVQREVTHLKNIRYKRFLNLYARRNYSLSLVTCFKDSTQKNTFTCLRPFLCNYIAIMRISGKGSYSNY